jgi:hypothetical protein
MQKCVQVSVIDPIAGRVLLQADVDEEHRGDRLRPLLPPRFLDRDGDASIVVWIRRSRLDLHGDWTDGKDEGQVDSEMVFAARYLVLITPACARIDRTYITPIRPVLSVGWTDPAPATEVTLRAGQCEVFGNRRGCAGSLSMEDWQSTR